MQSSTLNAEEQQLLEPRPPDHSPPSSPDPYHVPEEEAGGVGKASEGGLWTDWPRAGWGRSP